MTSSAANTTRRTGCRYESRCTSFAACLTIFQAESRSSNEEYNMKSRELHTELESYKQEKRNLRERVVCSLLHFLSTLVLMQRHAGYASKEDW